MRLLALDPRPGRAIRRLRFSADGRLLTAVSDPADRTRRTLGPWRSVVVFDLDAAAPLPEPYPPPDTQLLVRIGDPAFGPDPLLRAELWGGSTAHTVLHLTDDRGDRPEYRRLAWQVGAPYTAVEFSADGTALYVGVGDGEPGWIPAGEATLKLFRLDVADWPSRTHTAVPVPDPTEPTCFADAGGRLAVGTSRGTAHLLGGNPLVVEHDDESSVEGVLFSPDGWHLVTLGGGRLTVWDALSGRDLARPGDRVSDAAFAPDGRLIAVGPDGTACRFDPLRYELAERLDLGHGPLYGVAVAPNGLTAAAGTANGTVVLWDL